MIMSKNYFNSLKEEVSSMKAFLVSILVFCLLPIAHGQTVCTVSTDKDSISIGESIYLYLKLESPNPAGVTGIDFTAYDTLSSALDKTLYDSLDYNADIEWEYDFSNGKKVIIPKAEDFKSLPGATYKDSFKLTFWDAGLFLLPAPIIRSKDGQEVIYGQDVQIAVVPPRNIVNTDTSSIILPISDIIPENNTLENYLWFIYLFISVLLGFLIYRVFSQKEEIPIISDVERVELPAFIVAENKLEELRSLRLWEVDKVKEHQSQLTFIIREYLENKFGIKALESTSFQIQNQLKTIGLSVDHQNKLNEILQIADLVKFAKAVPPYDINETFINKALEFVNDTKIKASEDEIQELIVKRQQYLDYLNNKSRFNLLSDEEVTYINTLNDSDKSKIELVEDEKKFAAPLSKRIIATFIDYLLLVLFAGGISYGIGQLTQDPSMSLLLYPILLFIFLFVLSALESKNGQTPGKRSSSIKIQHLKGKDISFAQSLLRNVIKLFCVSLILPMITVIVRPDRRAPYDLMLDLMVISKTSTHG